MEIRFLCVAVILEIFFSPLSVRHIVFLIFLFVVDNVSYCGLITTKVFRNVFEAVSGFVPLENLFLGSLRVVVIWELFTQ